MTELELGIQDVTVNGVRYPVETETEKPAAGGLGVHDQVAKPVGEVAGHVLTASNRISVPAEALLAFQIQDPIRLRGYQR